jgi:hypothetical protein
MRKLVMLVVALFVVASPAVASPPALLQGHWSLGFEADRDVNVNVGYGLADMTRLIVSGGIVSPGDDVTSSIRAEYSTSFSAGIGLHRYINAATNDRFASFFGGGITFTKTGETTQRIGIDSLVVEQRFDPSDTIEIDGRFGVEAFPWEEVSVSGYVGVSGVIETDAEREGAGGVGGLVTVDPGNDVSTFSSALIVTFYWGGEE